MVLEITHPEKPTEQNKIDDNSYMLPHAINGVLPDFSSFPNMKARIPILIEEKTIKAGSTSVAFENLDGDTDELYYITGELDLVRVSIDSFVYIKINTETNLSNFIGVQTHQYRSSSPGYSNLPTTDPGFRIVQDRLGNQQTTFYAYLHAKSGKKRLFNAFNTHFYTGNVLITTNILSWSNTTDNITTLTFIKDAGSFSGTIKLYKIVDIDLQELS